MEDRSSPLLRLLVEIRKSLPELVRGNSNLRENIRTMLECVGVIAAIVLAIFTFRTLQTANSQLLQARRANDDLEKQFEAQQRAWVGNEAVSVTNTIFLVYPGNPPEAKTQVDFDVKVPLKNVGNSPAVNVETWMNATMTEQIGASPITEAMMESTCRADKSTKSVGQVLFPNSPATTVEWPMNVGTPFILINQVHRVWLDICVTYNGATADQQIHHTKIWMASWPINGKPTEIRRVANPRIIYYSLPITGWVVVKTEAD